MMQLNQYLSPLDREKREAFAKRCGISIGHLQNVACGFRAASAQLAVSIERESGSEVTRIDMFPDTFAAKWPELAKKEKNTPTALIQPAPAATETIAQGAA